MRSGGEVEATGLDRGWLPVVLMLPDWKPATARTTPAATCGHSFPLLSQGGEFFCSSKPGFNLA